MRICVVGVGSIGGHLAVLLANAGHEVSVIARGGHLEAIRRNGLRLIGQNGHEQVARNLTATDHIPAAGVQELVILAVKAHQVAPIVDELPALFDAATVLLSVQNGIPWWYFQRHGGPHDGRCVRAVDPHAHLMNTIDPRRIVGCVVYPAAALAGPGVIRHLEGDRYPLGELDGMTTERVTRIANAFVAAGLKAPVLDDIRAEMWLKLWGNLTFNPVSALAHATLDDICRFPLTRTLAHAMMREAQEIAGRLGIEFRVTIEQRIAGAEKVGKHKTSMLQDIEAGREPEIDALVGAVIELGQLTGVPTPHIETVYALAKLLGQRIMTDRVGVRAVTVAGVPGTTPIGTTNGKPTAVA